MDNHFAFNEAIRQKLDHEHSVMSSRKGWHHAVQIAMFTGFYVLMDTKHETHFIQYALPILGIVYAFSAMFSIWVSEKARACILMHWDRYRRKNCNVDWENLPPVSGDPFSHLKNSAEDPMIRKDMHLKCLDLLLGCCIPHGFMLYRFIPILFVILWTVCLIEIIS